MCIYTKNKFKKVSVFILFLLFYSYVFSTELRYLNIAKTILNSNDRVLVLATSDSSLMKTLHKLDEEECRHMLVDLRRNLSSSYQFLTINSFCKETEKELIVKWSIPDINYPDLNIFVGDIWLLVLESVFESDNKTLKKIHWEMAGEKFSKNILNTPYINSKNLFYIPQPEKENAICIYKSFTTPKLPEMKSIPYKEDLVEDIQLLSKLFCDRKDKPFKALRVEELELVTKVMSSLKTEEGKKIAEAMASIIEDEIIKVEFPKSLEDVGSGVKDAVEKVKKASDALNFEAVEKHYK
ncbi:MAG: hypothetical protein R3Y28_08740 [Candidatus Gastranaerophilales bacterium]